MPTKKRVYTEEQKKKKAEYQRMYRETMREEQHQTQLEYQRRYREKNKDIIKKKRKDYREQDLIVSAERRRRMGVVVGEYRCSICKEKGHSRRTCPHGDNPLISLPWDHIVGEVIVYCPPAK